MDMLDPHTFQSILAHCPRHADKARLCMVNKAALTELRSSLWSSLMEDEVRPVSATVVQVSDMVATMSLDRAFLARMLNKAARMGSAPLVDELVHAVKDASSCSGTDIYDLLDAAAGSAAAAGCARECVALIRAYRETCSTYWSRLGASTRSVRAAITNGHAGVLVAIVDAGLTTEEIVIRSYAHPPRGDVEVARIVAEFTTVADKRQEENEYAMRMVM
jgi:hypothetical protein